MKRISLPRLNAEEARLRQRIGAGQCFPYQLNDDAGALTLRLTSAAPASDALALRCDGGPLWIGEAESVLALLSDCPALPYAEAALTPWYWPLFNQAISPQIATLLGELAPDDVAASAAPLTLRLTLTLGDLRAQGSLTAPIATINALLDKPGWQPVNTALPDALPLGFPLILGGLTLSVAQLTRLRPEDVLLPTRASFSPDGEGRVRLGGLQLSGTLNGEADRAFFTLSDLEIPSVTFPYDNDDTTPVEHSEEEWQDEPTSEVAAFDALPLALTVRCGQLRLTLGELQRLNRGATVMVDNVQPGEALLCHGDFPLAKGELVDVEGRLGLQITHMLPGSVNPLSHGR
ncbi:FliM/FliN family flagellar motor switch protein [Mixta calida]|uniref:FliM/FliN family flagellar motor switch protein n=2 Tax=Mixta calida TaxID=665913 RepID=UPI00119F1529|nr:FliM/FliN family flagellar motor switch protein [Mixta calida]KAF0861470.1 hypothetical protein Y888_00860 [Mixta calida B021323]